MHRTERMITLSKIAEKDSEDAGYRIRAIDVLNKMDGDYVQKVEVTTPDDGTLKEMENYFASKKEILDLLYYKPYLVGHWVGFTDLTQLHNEWLRSFLYGGADQTLLAHRGSYKTTVLSLFLALHIVLFPNEFVIFFRKTDDDTKEVIKQVGKILASGCVQKSCKFCITARLSL